MKNILVRQELIRFIITGGSCFLFEMATLYILTEFAGIHYLFSAGIAFTLSVGLNYWLCVKWVFQGAKKRGMGATLIFVGSSLAGLAINQLCMWFFVEFAKLYYLMAKVLATAIVTIWNYLMKRWALKR